MTDRQKFNSGQEVIFQDLNSLQGRLQRGIFDRMLFEMMGRKSDGFFSDGFKLVFASSTSFTIKAGLGFMIADTGTKEPIKKPIALDADSAINIDTPDSSFDRIDILVVKWARVDKEVESRKFKDEFTDVISNQNFTISTDWSVEVQYIAGTPDPSPAAEATPAGFLKLGEIFVTTSTGIADQAAITDSRTALPVSSSTSATGTPDLDAIVGIIGTDQGANFADLKAALDNSSDGWKILVIRDQTPSSVPVVTKNNIQIEYKRGISTIKNSTNIGLQVDGNDCKVINSRYQDFDTGGDFGIKVNAGALRCVIQTPRFNNCDGNIEDLGTDTYIDVEYTE